MNTRLLFLGDIVGKSGRKRVFKRVRDLCARFGADVVVANAENASGGLGLTAKNAQDLLDSGVDLLTSGNHIWKYNDIGPFLEENKRCIRPANYPLDPPGRGVAQLGLTQNRELYVLNLLGRTYMEPVDCPFQAADRFLSNLPLNSPVIVDFHAEATSEKKAMAYYLSGRVTAVIGTHTHVQTNDAQVVGNTGYVTDAGMCGPFNSVLGMDPRTVLHKFITSRPVRFKLADGPVELCGVVVDFDPYCGACTDIFVWKENGPGEEQ